MIIDSPRWFKSSYSDNGGDCIEVAANVPGIVPVRDSKDPHGPQLTLTREAFAGLVRFVKAHG
ncbi:DUF397 domain-containing protein [Streptomyces sp. WZ-12]|uniref:DUF397 domain-containing protein n=1 Tax=Streptomyces sp. WZ-12 TaxID=3030210 RepID=UPI002381504B|nr:DUF397 domain-containing protein [Streptomyces sp. WZ-12]